MTQPKGMQINSKGFTLFEWMITTGLLGTVVLAMIQLSTTFIPLTRNAQNQADAASFWHDVTQSLSDINLCTSAFLNIRYNPESTPPSNYTMGTSDVKTDPTYKFGSSVTLNPTNLLIPANQSVIPQSKNRNLVVRNISLNPNSKSKDTSTFTQPSQNSITLSVTLTPIASDRTQIGNPIVKTLDLMTTQETDGTITSCSAGLSQASTCAVFGGLWDSSTSKCSTSTPDAQNLCSSIGGTLNNGTCYAATSSTPPPPPLKTGKDLCDLLNGHWWSSNLCSLQTPDNTADCSSSGGTPVIGYPALCRFSSNCPGGWIGEAGLSPAYCTK